MVKAVREGRRAAAGEEVAVVAVQDVVTTAVAERAAVSRARVVNLALEMGAGAMGVVGAAMARAAAAMAGAAGSSTGRARATARTTPR